ncbi:MAG TPA: agmatinase [Bacteroidales bacterium]|nr:agmatinase [Bacteroidales bacterium]
MELTGFNPNATANTGNNIFGLPYAVETSKVVIIPIPWEVTVSNFEGAAQGPGNVLEQSFQIDLFDPFNPNGWKQGYAMEAIDHDLIERNKATRALSREFISLLEAGHNMDENPQMLQWVRTINVAGDELCTWLKEKCKNYLGNNQIPIVLGGDHSVPLGLIKALAEIKPGFGILQIDAHADLRKDYQGFLHSHASVMRNAIQTPGVNKLVQLGIRELCDEEQEFINSNSEKINTYYDHTIRQRQFEGESWQTITEDIVSKLPQSVYVSFDVDGLQPYLCPGTGTPLPGGLAYQEALYLLQSVIKSGRRIIGADVVETGSGKIDGITTSRLLFRMAGLVCS